MHSINLHILGLILQFIIEVLNVSTAKRKEFLFSDLPTGCKLNMLILKPQIEFVLFQKLHTTKEK